MCVFFILVLKKNVDPLQAGELDVLSSTRINVLKAVLKFLHFFFRYLSMADDSDGLDLNRYEKELNQVLMSSFVPYKNPKNSYHHLINCFAVDLGQKRGGDATCKLEVKWKDLKSRDFPKDEMVQLIERAAKKVSTAKQTKISNFFTSKSKIESSASAQSEPPESDVRNEYTADLNIYEPETCLEDLEEDVGGEETYVHFKKLCII